MIHYFIEVSIAWALFYAIYFIFLKRETFFNINRWYLLHTIWIGAVIPFVRKIPISLESVEPMIMQPVQLIHYSTYAFSEAMAVPVEESMFNYQYLVYGLYFLGLMFFSVKFFHGLKNIWKLWRSGEKVIHDDFTMVLSDDYHLPFSFLNFVFLHRSFLDDDAISEIIDHEMIHVKSRHTFDVLFFELVSILFWWNPIIYFYKKEIRQTHEYVADAYASQSTHIKNYGQILLGQSSSGIELALSNQFFNSYLKKRINMLYKKKSAHYKLSKYLLVIPILFFLCVLYSFKNNPDGTKPIVSVSTGITTAVTDFISGVTGGCEGCDETATTLSEWNGKETIKVEKEWNDNEVLDVHKAYNFKLINVNKNKEWTPQVNIVDNEGKVLLENKVSILVNEWYDEEMNSNLYLYLWQPISREQGQYLSISNDGQFFKFPIFTEDNGIDNIQAELTKDLKFVESIHLINGRVIEIDENVKRIKADKMRVYSNDDQIREEFNIEANGKYVRSYMGNVSIENYKSLDFKLYQNVPNPFKDETVIAFDLSIIENVSLTIYNIQNDIVKSYQDGFHIGKNEIVLKKDDLPDGKVFYYTLKVGEENQTKKLVYSENEDVVGKEEVEYMCLYNGKVIDNSKYDFHVSSDAATIYTDDQSIKEKFGIDANGKHAINFIGNIRSKDGMRLVTKWDQNKPLDIDKAYSLTLMNLSGDKNWNPKYKIQESDYADIDLITDEDLPNSIDILIHPIKVTESGKAIHLTCSAGSAVLTKAFTIGKSKATSTAKKEVHVAASSFLPTTVENPMIIIDGKISESKNAHYFTQSRIKSTKALTKEESISKYGDRSQDGALEVVMHSEESGVITASKSGEDIFKIVEEMPRYPGCEVEGWTKEQKSKCAQENLIEWIYENLKYTDEAVENKVEGKVYVQFIVEKDGAITNINVVRDIGYGCGDQVKKLLSVMPKWIPGKQRGVPVRVLFTLPVKFMIDSDEGSVKPVGISRSTFNSDCDDPVTIIDGRLVASLDIEPDQIKEINVFKNKVPERFIQYKNDCGIVEIITKNPKKHRGTDGSSSRELKGPKLTKELLPPNPPKDIDLLPPPPPPSPDQAVLDLLEECENPVLIVNGDQVPFSVYNKLYRNTFKNMRISSDEFPMMEYRDENDCGVIVLSTEEPKLTTKNISEALSKSVVNQDVNPSISLKQNEPNPFYDKTTVGFSIPDEQLVSFEIYDVSGKVVRKFEEQSYPKGHNEIIINQSDLSGGGVYYIRMVSGKFDSTKKIVYVEGRD